METHLVSKNAGAWPLIAAAVALLAVTMGTRSVFGLFLSPLNSATGMGIAAISFAVALSQLAWGAAQPFCGVHVFFLVTHLPGVIELCGLPASVSGAARAVGIALFLAAPKTGLTVLAFSIWMGLTYMAVLPPTAGLIGKLYGAARLPTLLGITFVVHQAGAFLGSWLGGVVLEATGSYDRMWVLDLTLAALAAAVSLAIREQQPPARRPAPEPRLAVQA